jgi:AraC-like DNA-binding protein
MLYLNIGMDIFINYISILMKTKPENFPNQRLFRLPEELLQRAQSLPVCRNLTLTDTGFFPETAGHRVSRPQGCTSSILLFCVGGQGWVRTEKETTHVRSGTLVWIPAGIAHHYGANPEDPWRLYWLHVAGTGIAEWESWIPCAEEGVAFWRVSEPMNPAERFETLWRHIDAGGTDLSLLRMSAEAQALLAEAVATRESEGARARHLERRVERSVVWMRENLHRSVRLADCARAAGLSPSHYSAVFRENTGVPPLKYFTRLRLRKASEWLDGEDWSIQEIADRLGYANPFHFSKAFRTFTGLSPRAYRNRIEGR